MVGEDMAADGTVPTVSSQRPPDGLVDLRSDTVTRPNAAMRRAMAEAEVGDDGFGDDPTVNHLQELFAERMGQEAALFMPSGTMANQVALRVLARPGSLVVTGRRQHVVTHEGGAFGLNQSAQLHVLDDADGTIDPSEVAFLVEAAGHRWPAPSVVCVENTHMASGGRAWPVERLEELVAVGVPVHLDGARLFNAAVATGVPPARYGSLTATVTCCLSKGLGAPVGSLLAGSAELIAAARRERKRLGGGMRQVGVLAAAGIVALETMVDRLAEDHERARRLGDAVNERWPEASCAVATNVVVFSHPDPAGLLGYLQGEGVLAVTLGPGVVRLVTHVDVDDDRIDRAVAAIRKAPS
jgi:threonine aldolase